MNKKTENRIIDVEKGLCDIRKIIANGIVNGEITGVSQEPEEGITDYITISFNRMSENGNIYFPKKIRNKYLNNLFEKFEKSEVNYIGIDNGKLSFWINTLINDEIDIDIVLFDLKYTKLFRIDFEMGMFDDFYIDEEEKSVNIIFNSWKSRKKYLRRVFEYMKFGFVSNILISNYE